MLSLGIITAIYVIKICTGVESFTISTINFSFHGSNKRFFDTLYEGLNQAYMLVKLRNTYHIVSICSFGSITGNKYITAISTKFISFFFIWITPMIFDWYWKQYGYWKPFWKITSFCRFSLIHLIIYWI